MFENMGVIATKLLPNAGMTAPRGSLVKFLDITTVQVRLKWPEYQGSISKIKFFCRTKLNITSLITFKMLKMEFKFEYTR